MEGMKERTVIVSYPHPRVTLIQINRPKRRNAVDYETAVSLCEAFKTFNDDEEQRVAILAGCGGVFCAGADLIRIHEGQGNELVSDMKAPGPMGPTRMVLAKPVLACIEGYAVAGGLELAAWCDIRVASEHSRLGVLCRSKGVPLIDGGTVRLPQLLGLGRAMDLILTG